MTRPGSLGLLPSGPDPVGEWYVQRQPSIPYIGDQTGKNKRFDRAPFFYFGTGGAGSKTPS